MKRLRTKIALGLVAALCVGAAWWGTFDTPFNPQIATSEETSDFIRSVVNATKPILMWHAGDTVTLCQQGSSTCAIFAYVPGTALWSKARNTSSRDKPDEYWWYKFIRWLLGDASAYDPGYAQIPGGGGGGLSITGHWDQMVGNIWSGGVLIGTTVEWVFVVDSISTMPSVNRTLL